MDIRVVIKIHELIKGERTGTPKELSNKLGLSVRTVFNYIFFMKTELNAPIIYDSQNKKYSYERECELNFKG